MNDLREERIVENRDQGNYQDLFNQLQRMMNGDFWGAVSQLQQMRSNSSFMPPSWGTEFPFQSFFPGMNMEQLSQLMRQLQNMGGGWMGGGAAGMGMAPASAGMGTASAPAGPEGFRTKVEESFPIQLWESKEKIYLMAMIPGLKSEQEVKYKFKDDKKITLSVLFPDLKPQQESRLVHSEFPLGGVERTVTLPYPVAKGRLSSHYVKGVYTLILYKEGASSDDVWSYLEEE